MENYEGKKFCFSCNRFFVLEEMLNAKLDICRIFAVPGSFLQRELVKRNIPFEFIEDKKRLTAQLLSLDFDYFIANGLPVILPVKQLTEKNSKQFINIHPSLLPDMRGKDPVPGALLYGHSSGATCHFMNDGIDTGNIIEQVAIDYSEGLDCGLLYQLSFEAEKEVFSKALKNGFHNKGPQVLTGDEVYYNLKEADKVIDFNKDTDFILRQVKAFNSRTQGAYFIFNGLKVIVRDAEIVTNSYLIDKTKHLQENEVVFVYEQKILLKKASGCIKLKQIESLPDAIIPGCLLTTF